MRRLAPPPPRRRRLIGPPGGGGCDEKPAVTPLYENMGHKSCEAYRCAGLVLGLDRRKCRCGRRSLIDLDVGRFLRRHTPFGEGIEPRFPILSDGVPAD